MQYEEPFFLVLFEDVSSAAAHLRQAIELTSTPEGRESAKDRQILELREEADYSPNNRFSQLLSHRKQPMKN